MLKFQDDWYEGYFIPAGTICVANVWAMNRDPEIWGTDAPEFKPERHLDERGRLAKAPVDTRDEGHVTFGFGRRYAGLCFITSHFADWDCVDHFSEYALGGI